jgi:phosphinothricin acetyltransferase
MGCPGQGHRQHTHGTTMYIRLATPADSPALVAIYAPIVRDTAISFELDPPDAAEMARRSATPMPASIASARPIDGPWT